jgi:hypothetical protein
MMLKGRVAVIYGAEGAVTRALAARGLCLTGRCLAPVEAVAMDVAFAKAVSGQTGPLTAMNALARCGVAAGNVLTSCREMSQSAQTLHNPQCSRGDS